MARNFIGYLITSFGNMVDRTWGFMKVITGVFIGLVLTMITLTLLDNSRPSFEFFSVLTAGFTLISYITILYVCKKFKI